MNKQRKETIINEIKYWKESRLLPEQYCDYLLALYTEGERGKEKGAISKKNVPFLFLAFLIPMFVPITFLVIYFTEMSIDLQMVLVTFFILLSLLGYFVFRKKRFFIHIPVIVTALLILLLTVRGMELFPAPSYFPLIIIGAQAVIWFIVGFWKRWFYLNAASIATFLLFLIIIILK